MLNLNYINCRQPAKKGQVYFGRFYLGKRRQGRDAYSVAALFLGEGSINGTESPF